MRFFFFLAGWFIKCWWILQCFAIIHRQSCRRRLYSSSRSTYHRIRANRKRVVWEIRGEPDRSYKVTFNKPLNRICKFKISLTILQYWSSWLVYCRNTCLNITSRHIKFEFRDYSYIMKRLSKRKYIMKRLKKLIFSDASRLVISY